MAEKAFVLPNQQGPINSYKGASRLSFYSRIPRPPEPRHSDAATEVEGTQLTGQGGIDDGVVV